MSVKREEMVTVMKKTILMPALLLAAGLIWPQIAAAQGAQSAKSSVLKSGGGQAALAGRVSLYRVVIRWIHCVGFQSK